MGNLDGAVEGKIVGTLGFVRLTSTGHSMLLSGSQINVQLPSQ